MTDIKPFFCGECGRPCEATTETELNRSEFWGAAYSELSWSTASDCCDAVVYEDEALTKPVYFDDFDDA